MHRRDEGVNIGAVVVKRHGGAGRRRHIEIIHQRLRTVMADADGDPAAINNGADVMGMHPFQREGDNRRLMLCLTNDAQAVDIFQLFRRIGEQGLLMRHDPVEADIIHIVDGRAKADGLHDGRRARLKLRMALGEGGFLERYPVDHIATTKEGRHGLQQRRLAI